MKRTMLLGLLWAAVTLGLVGQTITVVSPPAGVKWMAGGTYTITWTKSGEMNARVMIRLRSGDTIVEKICDDAANPGSYSWTIPKTVAPGSYYVRVRTVDNAVYGDSGVFQVVPPLPPPPSVLQLKAPVGGEAWTLGTPQQIRWHAFNVPGKLRLELVRHQGAMLGIIADDLNPGAGSFSWHAGRYGAEQSAPPGEYHVRIRSLADPQLSDESDAPLTLARPRLQMPLLNLKPDLVACTETAVYVPLKTLGYFHVHVRNVGTAPARAGFQVEVFMAGHTPIRYTVDKDLAPGESRWVVNIGDSKLRATTIGFMVTVDPDHTVAESNEENNRASGTLFIEADNPTSNSPIRCSDNSTL